MHCNVHVGNYTFLQYLWPHQWRSTWSRMGILYRVVWLFHRLRLHCRVVLDVSDPVVVSIIVDRNAY